MITPKRKLRSQGRPGISEKVKDEVIQAFNDGWTVAEIINAMGVSKSSCYRIIREREELKEHD
jgi:DNA invertase Pin-like site-specific DNA recombinase